LETVHATSIALNGKAVLIKGASGSGKSSAALELITLGAKLIADDQTILSLTGEKVFLSAPSTLPIGIEVRGIGVVNAPICKRAELKLVVDMSKLEKKRFPNYGDKKINILGYSFPLYFFQGIKNPAASIYALMQFGIVDI
jgi:HPr kinase/phosphorylase